MRMQSSRRLTAKRTMRGAILLVLLFLIAGGVLAMQWNKNCSGGLFSWSRATVQDEPQQLLTVMRQYGLTELYQTFSSHSDPAQLEPFLTQAAEQGVAVYVLVGEPEWGREADGASLRQVITRVAAWNEALPEGSRFAGVMADIEPYLLEEWSDSDARRLLMQRYVQGTCAAYAQAQDAGLELLVCIPYFYDTKGFTAELEQLAAEGCSGLAVMNYYRGKEAEHLRTEAELARRYGKRLLTIYELQPPGSHDLTDQNTYYQAGLDALADNYRALRRNFWRQRVDYALHSYPVLCELSEKEAAPDA